MEYLPLAVQRVLAGGIDPYSQQHVEWYSQIYLGVLVVLSFAASYFTASVLIALEIFTLGFVVLLVTCVPPWPFLNRHKFKFLPVRKPAVKSD